MKANYRRWPARRQVRYRYKVHPHPHHVLMMNPARKVRNILNQLSQHQRVPCTKNANLSDPTVGALVLLYRTTFAAFC